MSVFHPKFSQMAILEKTLKCIWVHQNNPFSRLGPFKFEIHHQDPEIISIHDFVRYRSSTNPVDKQGFNGVNKLFNRALNRVLSRLLTGF